MRSLRRSMCTAILGLEAVVLALTTPVMISLEDVSWQVATAVGVGLMVLCILVAGMLRKPWAYHLGWAIQIAAIALGFVVAVMWALGVIFLALWWTAFALGGRIDAERQAYGDSTLG